jgi:glycosyltransferase involved in cell wall biosynthesis
MKIVHAVSSYYPEQNGMSEVARQISEGLAMLGFDITVVTKKNNVRSSNFINGVKIVSFDIEGDYLKGYTGEINKYINFLKNEEYDLITLFAAQQWASDLVYNLLPEINAIKVFIPTGFSALYNNMYSEYYTNMKKWLNNFDKIIFLGEKYRDYEFAKNVNINPAKFIIIPNGASKKEFTSKSDFDIKKLLKIKEETKIILHVGSYTAYKGHKECLDIFSKIKYTNAVLVFVGDNFKTSEAIKFTSKINFFNNIKYKYFYRPWILKAFFAYLQNAFKGLNNKLFLVKLKRNELVQSFIQSDLLLFPSNIECSPVVLFEAMASKTPFLVSDVGNSKEIIEWSKAGILLPTKIDEFGFSSVNTIDSAIILDNILINDEQLLNLSNNGYNAWINNFTWEDIVVKYKNLYLELIHFK